MEPVEPERPGEGEARAPDEGRTSETMEELKVVMAEHQAGLLRYAGRILNDHAAAQDVVQDVFIRLHQGWRNGHQPAKSMGAWLYRVTHNAAVDHVRKESRKRLLHERQAEEAPLATPAAQLRDLDAAERQAFVRRYVRELSEPEQQVLLLRLQEGLSYQEIAEVTGVAQGTVKSRLFRARQALRDHIEARYGGSRHE